MTILGVEISWAFAIGFVTGCVFGWLLWKLLIERLLSKPKRIRMDKEKLSR